MDGSKASIVTLIVIIINLVASTDIFTSTFQLTELLNLEDTLDQALAAYIYEESDRLEKLREHLRHQRNILRRDDDLSHLSVNPVYTFTSTRQFLKGLKEVEKVVRQRDHSEEFLKRLQDHARSNISTADLEGAEEALLRLQIVYNISPRTFTNGRIVNWSLDRVFSSEKIDNHSSNRAFLQKPIDKRPENRTPTHETTSNQSEDRIFPPEKINDASEDSLHTQEKINNRSAADPIFSEATNSSLHRSSSGYYGYEGLTAMDNYRIGRQAYNTGKRKLAKLWMENVLGMMGTMDSVHDMTGQFSNYNKSLAYYEEIVRLDPHDAVQQSNLEQMKEKISMNEVSSPLPDDDEEYDDEMITYMSQCRQANDVTIPLPSNDPRLTCRYENKHPRTRIKPVAVETISVNPKIEVFRGVLSDKEIDELLSMAQPKLLRAAVNNFDTGKVEVAEYRISKKTEPQGGLSWHTTKVWRRKSAWLDDYDRDIVKTIDRRVAAITGLTTDTAELLQINNYGIGGHYEPHLDHAYDMSDSPIAQLGVGNRIATLMFYLSDVEAGGATAFIRTRVNTKPSKGDAVFWYNLKRSGEGDDRTLHAGCPVLVGNKWVANKWFHEHGNEFLHPCGLKEDE